jgi:hypothetical protein
MVCYRNPIYQAAAAYSDEGGFCRLIPLSPRVEPHANPFQVQPRTRTRRTRQPGAFHGHDQSGRIPRVLEPLINGHLPGSSMALRPSESVFCNFLFFTLFFI